MGAKHNIRVEGCPLGLDQDYPELPVEICQHPCDWRIDAVDFLNCAWIGFIEGPSKSMTSLRDMGKMFGMTHESVRTLLNEALRKIPRSEEELEDLFDELEINNVRKTKSREMTDKEKALARLLDG